MAVTLEEVLKMAEQLTPSDQRILVTRLLEQRKSPNELSKTEWMALFNSMVRPGGLGESYSDRREDWYSDDRR